MRIGGVILGASLFLAPLGAVAGDAPVLWYASGWPIALAEAACDGDEGCLTKLANCGPGDPSCGMGVSFCIVIRHGALETAAPCQTDRVSQVGKIRVRLDIPVGRFSEIVLGGAKTSRLDGRPAMRVGKDCVAIPRDGLTVCARPMVERAELETWAKEPD